MTNFIKNIAFPQVALFTVLILIIIYLLSKSMFLSIIIGAGVFYFGINGYFENIGIGTKSMENKCMEYLVKSGQCPLDPGSGLRAPL
jgi:multisubunit Na+/H+ antiporter MnhC subunit